MFVEAIPQDGIDSSRCVIVAAVNHVVEVTAYGQRCFLGKVGYIHDRNILSEASTMSEPITKIGENRCADIDIQALVESP